MLMSWLRVLFLSLLKYLESILNVTIKFLSLFFMKSYKLQKYVDIKLLKKFPLFNVTFRDLKIDTFKLNLHANDDKQEEDAQTKNT